jgi:hypothetical protein
MKPVETKNISQRKKSPASSTNVALKMSASLSGGNVKTDEATTGIFMNKNYRSVQVKN